MVISMKFNGSGYDLTIGHPINETILCKDVLDAQRKLSLITGAYIAPKERVDDMKTMIELGWPQSAMKDGYLQAIKDLEGIHGENTHKISK